ncbi:Radical SAM domain protein [Fibrella aestuarina BUZ 2]|uniref:Radical SAM domain protein n=1 Tax=Fibrella aestuarina BUZ 2 TaxID=1166018 RepID=I0KCJ1_9BACT|nr:radical SAM protein [Fibrella aestuarina]CCH01844.1 Radical SAM domain protein [Fibrella aestuarina BUZ 2]
MRLLLLTPPFTQLNTPYPATAYLKGYLNTLGRPSVATGDGSALPISTAQADLGIETILALFSPTGLAQVFDAVEAAVEQGVSLSENSERIVRLRDEYLATIGPTIRFLQHRNPTLAHAIAGRSYLPEAARFAEVDDLEWAFGTMGLQDKARHLATLYLEDLSDLIVEALDPHFGFSRYAERLGRSAAHFDELHEALQAPKSLIGHLLLQQLDRHMATFAPDLVCLSVPFPGNLFGALLCGQHIRATYPAVKVVLGGGYANTELRTLAEPRLFDYVDFVSLDDGEAPLRSLIEHLLGQPRHGGASSPQTDLKRTFIRNAEGRVIFCNGASEKDVPQREVGTPDYTGLPLTDYLSVIEVTNPMHRLWSDGRWNKLTLAHGCYWGKCSFCDISLDYIARYEPVTAALLCDRMEELIAQTGQNGFHFVDEAAPPALMRDVALEILRRRLTVVWWTNIRFESAFTADLCQLLKLSGCIAVSGGLEVASDRLLAKMKKGVTVAQVARVTDHFTQAGIMVHAYLMYGFPTQTAQETVDSLEMVRQLFAAGVVQSGFWHRFAMTAHSPVGLHPAHFDVTRIDPPGAVDGLGPFANNDLDHLDPLGADHDRFAEGLRKSLFNFMHGVGLDFPLKSWFDFPIPGTSVPKRFIENAIAEPDQPARPRANALVVWPGRKPDLAILTQRQGKRVVRQAELLLARRQDDVVVDMPAELGEWLLAMWPKLSTQAPAPLTYAHFKADFDAAGLGTSIPGTFDAFLLSETWADWQEAGLLIV